MPTETPLRLTPKIRELVATDRHARPPTGRLTASQVDALTRVALHTDRSDEPVLAPRALLALATGRPAAATPVLRQVINDRHAVRGDRVAAARGLALVATPVAQEALVTAVDDPDPRVQQASLAALGRFADEDCAGQLRDVVASEAYAQRQLDFTRALIAHRFGLDGPFLSAPLEAASRPPGQSSAEVSLRPKSAQATAAATEKLQGSTFGVEPARRSYTLRCGLKEWTIFVNREVGRSFASLTNLHRRPWIAAVLGLWYPPRLLVSTQYVVLARPIDDMTRLDVVRTDGELVYTGEASISGSITTFSIAHVHRQGAAPLLLSGRLGPKGVNLDVARAALSRVDTRTTEGVPTS